MELSTFIPVWNKLTAAQQESLAYYATERSVTKGTTVYSRGEECSGLLLVKSGQLRAFILSPEGREITLYRLFERDMCLFSASCMMRSIQFDITITAQKDTELFVIPADVYQSVMVESAPLANFTNEIMASRFSDVMFLLEQTLWKSVDKRLASFLLDESAIEGSSELHLTHEAIGNHLGNAREVITRMLRYFQSEGWVELSRGTITVTDEKSLRALQDA